MNMVNHMAILAMGIGMFYLAFSHPIQDDALAKLEIHERSKKGRQYWNSDVEFLKRNIRNVKRTVSHGMAYTGLGKRSGYISNGMSYAGLGKRAGYISKGMSYAGLGKRAGHISKGMSYAGLGKRAGYVSNGMFYAGLGKRAGYISSGLSYAGLGKRKEQMHDDDIKRDKLMNDDTS